MSSFVLVCIFLCLVVNFSRSIWLFFQVSCTFAVPPIIMFLNKHPAPAKYDLTSLKRIISGAAPLGKEMVEEMHAKRPHVTVGQGMEERVFDFDMLRSYIKFIIHPSCLEYRRQNNRFQLPAKQNAF